MHLNENTIIFLTSDHGEEFKDHGSMGHMRTLYRESIRVPLIIVFPRKIKSDQRVEEPASLVDILPTVLSLANVPSSHFC